VSIDPGPEGGAVTALTAAMRLLDVAKLQGFTFRRVATGDDGRRGGGRYRAICDADFLCEFNRAGLGAVPDVRTVGVIVSGPLPDGRATSRARQTQPVPHRCRWIVKVGDEG
jgi:hypothetical protein